MGLETVTTLSQHKQRFLYVRHPMDDRLQGLLTQRHEILEETNCNLALVPHDIDDSTGIDYIWRIPAENEVDDNVAVVQWTTPKGAPV